MCVVLCHQDIQCTDVPCRQEWGQQTGMALPLTWGLLMRWVQCCAVLCSRKHCGTRGCRLLPQNMQQPAGIRMYYATQWPATTTQLQRPHEQPMQHQTLLICTCYSVWCCQQYGLAIQECVICVITYYVVQQCKSGWISLQGTIRRI